MPTKLEVFNQALLLMGQEGLTSPDQDSKDGRVLRTAWNSVLERCHESTAWDFAKEQMRLTRLATGPTYKYDYYYTLPSDIRRLLEVSETGEPGDKILDYEIHVNKIATSRATVYITYVSDISFETPGRWSATFGYYVACELAMMTHEQINKDVTGKIEKELRRAKSDAIGIDAAQGPPVRRQHGTFSSAARGYNINRSREQG